VSQAPQGALQWRSGATLALLCGTIWLALGCAPVHEPTSILSAQVNRATGAPGLTFDQLRNATYRGIYDRPVTLTDGKYEGAPFQPGGAARPQLVFAGGLVARGDLNHDGGDEAVVMLAESSGASGTFNYLAVVAAQDGKPVNVATAALGDRVQLRAMKIVGGQLIVDLVAHGPGEAMCCPTLKVRRTLTLNGDRLVEVGRQEMGPISVADLAGVTWRLEEISFGEPVPAEPAISLRIDKEQIVGAAGCNNYFAPYTRAGPGKIAVAAAGATRKACSEPIMNLEARYLRALEAVTSYSFLAGRLALTYRREGAFATLLFTPSIN
jgi:heat shock protein HslJ